MLKQIINNMLNEKFSTCGKGTISINLCLHPPNSLLYARYSIIWSKNSSVYGLIVVKRNKKMH